MGEVLRQKEGFSSIVSRNLQQRDGDCDLEVHVEIILAYYFSLVTQFPRTGTFPFTMQLSIVSTKDLERQLLDFWLR